MNSTQISGLVLMFIGQLFVNVLAFVSCPEELTRLRKLLSSWLVFNLGVFLGVPFVFGLLLALKVLS